MLTWHLVSTSMRSETVTDQLCLACGLCCSGVLFKDVKLERSEKREMLRAAGISLRSEPRGGAALPQPCPALCADNRCRIYEDRPNRCRAFECALFKAVAAEDVTPAAALKTIRAARRQVDKVRRLLVRTGDADEGLALSLRFRRVQRRFEQAHHDQEATDAFGELTRAMHALNVILSATFYPGAR